MQILLVDDSRSDRKLMKEHFRRMGLKDEFFEAEDGQEALDVLGKNYSEIDLVLLDLNMPRMDGYEFLKEFRDIPQYSQIPVIIWSAAKSDETELKVRLIYPQLTGCFSKGMDASKTVQKILSFLLPQGVLPESLQIKKEENI